MHFRLAADGTGSMCPDCYVAYPRMSLDIGAAWRSNEN